MALIMILLVIRKNIISEYTGNSSITTIDFIVLITISNN